MACPEVSLLLRAPDYTAGMRCLEFTLRYLVLQSHTRPMPDAQSRVAVPSDVVLASDPRTSAVGRKGALGRGLRM